MGAAAGTIRRLTTDGRSLVEQAHALNLLLDVGRPYGEQTSLDVIARADGRPVICFIGLTALNPISAIRAIALYCDCGHRGRIGVLCLNDYLAKNAGRHAAEATPQAPRVLIWDHLDYLETPCGAVMWVSDRNFVEGQDLSEAGTWPGNASTPDIVSPGDESFVIPRF